MKKISFLLCIVLLTGINSLSAQTLDDNSYALVREDFVKPSMTADYEAALASLSDFLTENKVKDVHYLTQLQDNYHYSHISFIKNLEQVETGLPSYFEGKKNSAEFNLLWDYLNETIDGYQYYVVRYKTELSYVKDENLWLEKAPYRKWNYYYFKPGTEKQAEQIMASWKSLYEKKGIKTGFRVFKGVVGLESPVYIFTMWDESPLTFQQNLQETIKMLDDEGVQLWMAMMELVNKVETVEGWYLPQYSYQPE